MSGSIGGSRILREEVQPTLDNYINNVLKGFSGFVSAQITGSYNAGTKKDHGDIDLAVYIEGDDIKKIKKDFKEYLESLDDELTPRFVFGRNKGRKAQMYGTIVTCGSPILGREDHYVQVDNIIVNSKEAQRFQKEFLDLDAAKQGLLMGLIRVILNYRNFNTILNRIEITNLPGLGWNQEYEFVLSSAGVSLRRVTLNEEMKEVSRDELWRSCDWDVVKFITNGFDFSLPYEELLDKVAVMTMGDDRSRRRIIGIMKSMVNIGIAEQGTPKGDAKENAIRLIEEKLK